MPSPETLNHYNNPQPKIELLKELSIIESAILPYLETALAIDETQHLDNLLEQRDWILDDLEQYQ